MVDWTKHSSIPWLERGTIYLTRHGSHAYGTNTEGSDVDLKGVAVPPRPYWLGFSQRFEQAEQREPHDSVIYDLRKFFALAADCNPNIIEVLWTAPGDHLVVRRPAEQLLGARRLFLSRKARHTFTGYAVAQLKRIATHRRWLLNPPDHDPTRAEFGLPDRPEVKKESRDVAEAMIRKKLDEWQPDLSGVDAATRTRVQAQVAVMLAEAGAGDEDGLRRRAGAALGIDENLMDVLQRERLYTTRKREWDQYQEWKRSRNPTRAALEAEHGYDTKHGMHLVRLMRMCREILTTGEVLVKRPDAEELLAVRRGAWSFEKLAEYAAAEDAGMAAAEASSPLPRAPDRAALDELCQAVVEAHFRELEHKPGELTYRTFDQVGAVRVISPLDDPATMERL